MTGHAVSPREPLTSNLQHSIINPCQVDPVGGDKTGFAGGFIGFVLGSFGFVLSGQICTFIGFSPEKLGSFRNFTTSGPRSPPRPCLRILNQV
jgi:hypothetical protein